MSRRLILSAVLLSTALVVCSAVLFPMGMAWAADEGHGEQMGVADPALSPFAWAFITFILVVKVGVSSVDPVAIHCATHHDVVATPTVVRTTPVRIESAPEIRRSKCRHLLTRTKPVDCGVEAGKRRIEISQ